MHLDFNDIYWKDDPSHPSDIIPAALSIAEMVECVNERCNCCNCFSLRI